VKHFGAQFRFPLAAASGRPLAADVADFAAVTEPRQLRQCSRKHRMAARAVVRRPESAADRMIDECRARWRDLAHDVVCGTNDQSGNTAPFDDMRDETDGLMTEGSIGNEQGDIDARCGELVGKRRCKLVFDLLMPAHSAHKRKVPRRQRADGSIGN